MFFTHQAFYQDDFRNGVLLTLNPSNGVAGIGYHRISVWTRKYLELSLLRSVHNNVIAITPNKIKITFDECSTEKKAQSLHIFTKSLINAVKVHTIDSSQVQTIVKICS